MASSADRLRRYVDMWAVPGMHLTNLELLQQLKTADTQHFTKNMNVVGTVSEQDPATRKWEKTHLVGIRSDVWQPDKKELAASLRILKKQRRTQLKQSIKRSGQLNDKQAVLLDQQLSGDAVMQLAEGDLVSRRLVLKLFKITTTRVRWCGTLEQVTTTEIHNSIGSRRCLLTTAAMMPQTQVVTYVQQNHRTFRIPAIFTLGYFDDQRLWHLTLKQRWFSFGIDFDVEADGKRIGKLDGTLLTCGSDSYVNLDAHPLAKRTDFVDMLTLFSASVGYHRAMRRSLKRRLHATKKGEWHRLQFEDEELRLRHNGRAAA